MPEPMPRQGTPPVSAIPFVCPRCAMASFHPKDAQYGFCGACHRFFEASHAVPYDTPEHAFLVWSGQWGYLHARPITRGRYAAVRQFNHTWAVITAPMFDRTSVDDRWCYHSERDALRALEAWDGEGEPAGWHRHPRTGRRLAEGMDCYNDNDEWVEPGTMYVRR